MFWVHVLLCLAWCTFHVLWTRLHGVTSVRSSNPIHFYIYSYIPEQSSSMDQNPFVEACCPSRTKRCHAFYGIGRFINMMQFYSVTSLKRNLGTTQTCLRWKNSTVPGIWNSEDLNFAYLSQTEPALNGKKKKFRCRAVSLWAGFTVQGSIFGFHHVKSAPVARSKYSKTCLKRTPYIPETWTNGK